MKFIATLFTLIITLFAAQAKVYYLSPSGSNTNAGTISAPWLTFEHAAGQLIPGDTLYLRGGTYRSAKATGIVNRFYLANKYGSATTRICIMNYPGEKPVFDMSGQLILGERGDGPVGLKIENAAYLHIRGIRITGILQNPANINTPCGIILYNVDNSIIEQFEIDNVQGYGLYLQGGSDNNLIKNTDVHDIGDLYSGWEGANGFNITGGDPSTNNVFEGCRAWRCSDDGFDLFGTNTIATFRNCWAFWNGFKPNVRPLTAAGDGQGFKLGPMVTDNHTSATVYRRLERCISIGNRLNGFDQNSQNNTAGLIEAFNCTAAFNGSNGYFFGANTSINQRFKNNLNYGNRIWGDEIQSGPNVTNNSWNGYTVTGADFISVDTSELDNPRQADGSLPVLSLMRPAPGSRLIDAGTASVGLTYSGSAPDIGAIESGTVTAPPPPPPPVKTVLLTIHVYSDKTVSTAVRVNKLKTLVCDVRVYSDGAIEKVK